MKHKRTKLKGRKYFYTKLLLEQIMHLNYNECADLELSNKSPTSLRRSVRCREIQALENITAKISTPVKTLPKGKGKQHQSDLSNVIKCVDSPKRSPRKTDFPMRSPSKIDLLISSPRKVVLSPKRSSRKNNSKAVVIPLTI